MEPEEDKQDREGLRPWSGDGCICLLDDGRPVFPVKYVVSVENNKVVGPQRRVQSNPFAALGHC